jgi:hypothetical protein
MKHLDLRSGSATASLKEIAGRPNSVRTEVVFKLTDTTLSIRVEAEDLDMLHLISSVSAPNQDPYLYEEDVIQIAFALPGQVAINDWLVINPHGSRKGSPAALEWSTIPTRHGNGWSMALTIPRPPVPVMGLSLHRYYRGVNHEVQGLGTNLPHPLEPARFAVLILDGPEPAMDADHHFRHQAQAAAHTVDQKAAEAIHQRLIATRTRPDFAQLTSLDQAIRLAEVRAQRTLEPHESFLCWNEGHFLHAVLNLWELTQDHRWIDLALNRMEGVWSARGRAPDGTVLPTWINDRESGVPCTLVTGAILWPITRLLGLIHEIPALAEFKNRIRGWVPRAEEALAYHDDEWIALPDGSGMHIEPYQKGPRRIYTHPAVRGSRINPVNREYFYTLAMMELNRFKRHPEHLRKIWMNALFFKHNSDWTNDRWAWEYEIGRYPACGEDIDHGSCQVEFAHQCAKDGIIFTESDLEKMATTLAQNIYRLGEVPSYFIRGYNPNFGIGVALWSRLCRFPAARPLFPHIEALIATAVAENHACFDGSEGWGIRLLSALEQTRRVLAGGK